MLDLLGDFIVRLIPVSIPIILIWSFLINHGLAPTSSKGSDDSSKESKKSKEDGSGGGKKSPPDSKGPEG